MTCLMECHCIGLGEIPHTTRLFSSYIEHFSRVEQFYAHPPTGEGIQTAARHARLEDSVLGGVVDVLREQNRNFGGGTEIEKNLDLLADGAAAIVTGQQMGLFTGPAYSIYKAVSALRTAAEVTGKGTPVVPVFWLATEDHDLQEVDHCFWQTRQGLERLQFSAVHGDGRRVGEVRFDDTIAALVDKACGWLEGPAAEEIGKWLRESYRAEETLGSAFGKLMARVFAGRGLVLMDPLDRRLHRLAAPVFRRALEENEAITSWLLERSKELERAGYHSQVKVMERGTLLFLSHDGKRLPVRRSNHGFSVARAHFSLGELVAALERAPEDFSPNALLRPVMQDALLPTAAYIAGPAEIAYLAQSQVVYRRLLGRMPAVLPRASFTLVEPHIARLLKKYGMDLRDCFLGRQHLRAKLERQYLSKGLARRFDRDEKALKRMLEGIRGSLGRLDSTLVGAADMGERKMLHQLQTLRAKASRAEGFRTGVLDAHEKLIWESLYPQKGLQERTVCFLPLMARQGRELLGELEKRAGLGQTHHQVLFL